MKIIVIVTLLLCSLGGNPIVFVCDNPTTEVYHLDENCRGLKKCKQEVKKITLDRAKSLKKRLCNFED